ncbi:SAM domain and HD [Irineochytrium annulatum]|nr:SAM domain and HD [Irineochytrium annulatum]
MGTETCKVPFQDLEHPALLRIVELHSDITFPRLKALAEKENFVMRYLGGNDMVAVETEEDFAVMLDYAATAAGAHWPVRGKQLGSAYRVYTGASHNRFEHSLGVCYLAGQFIRGLRDRQQNELRITKRDVRCVELAGLLHDIGHGPFSHVFDNEFIKKARPELQGWSHEQMSIKMIEHMIEDNGIDIPRKDVDFIQDMIMGKPREGFGKEGDRRHFFYEIVNNKSTEVDVDKFDYILRDSFCTGVKSCNDFFERACSSSRVIDNRVVFNSKEDFNFHELFSTRFNLFKKVYTHRAVKAIDYMIVDALLAADKFFGISAAVDDPAKYTYLTDGIINRIKATDVDNLQKSDAEAAHAIRTSQAILKRISKRNLYCFVDQVVIPPTAERCGKIYENVHDEVKQVEALKTLLDVKRRPPPESTDNDADYTRIPDEDLVLEVLKINHCNKNKDPLLRLRYYSRKSAGAGIIRIPPDQTSSLRPKHFQELSLRLFVKNSDQDHHAAAFRLFENFLKEYGAGFGLDIERLRDEPLRAFERELENAEDEDESTSEEVMTDLLKRTSSLESNGTSTSPFSEQMETDRTPDRGPTRVAQPSTAQKVLMSNKHTPVKSPARKRNVAVATPFDEECAGGMVDGSPVSKKRKHVG